MALALILEFDPSFNLFSLATESQLLEHAEKSPPISGFLENNVNTKLTGNAQLLSSFFNQQLVWRDEFSMYIEKNACNVCIVGNASTLLDKNVGELIDKNSVVIRFNNFCYKQHLQRSCGSSIDVWVKSPDFIRPNGLSGVNVSWTIISGPDMRYTMSNWTNIKQELERGCKVLTPPLHIWKELVRILEAPPSAGLLIIAWVLEILEEPCHLSVAGFQLPTDVKGQYHYSSPWHKAAERHNWAGERNLLDIWQKEGINFIDRLNV